MIAAPVADVSGKRWKIIRGIIYGLGAFECAALLFLMALYASGPGTASGSGGPEMALFFFDILPLAALAIALATFRFVRWRGAKATAALVIVAPAIGFAYWGADELSYRATKRDYALGRDYFTSPAAQALAGAVVAGDEATVTLTARTVDVNQAGELDQTFIGLALTRSTIDLAIVEALLDAGADPNQKKGWPLSVAISRRNAELATMLLDRGADPSRPDGMDTPVFFGALDQPDMLALLLTRGARVDAVDVRGWTAVMRATWDARWPSVRLLLAAGADLAHVAPDGAGIDRAIAFVRYRADVEGKSIPPELVALEARIRDGSP